jgi:hypothetical protein
MRKKKTETQQNTYKRITVDVSDISDNLTDRARRFVFWYCFPGSDAFQNKTRSAIAVGYARNNVTTSGYKLCKNKQVIKEIERISKTYSIETIDSLYCKYVNTLETRAFYDPTDYISGAAFKKIEDIAPEKRVCLEQPVIDMKEGSVVGYTFGSRRAAMAEIKDAYEKGHPGGNDNEYDPEETIRIINEVAKTEVIIERRKRHDEMHKAFIEDGYLQLTSECIEEL